MKRVVLKCTGCGQEYSVKRSGPRCDKCNEPLETELVTRGEIRRGGPEQLMLERYADFFPFKEPSRRLSLGEGLTPLTESTSLASELRLNHVFLKNETMNPTWSFKDRGTAVALQHAATLGFDRIGTVSSGNMAASVAAYGARAGFETFVFVSTTMPVEKLNPISIYGARLVRVEGDYGKLYFQSLKVGEANGIYFMNSDVPFRVEGSKTIAYEICEQLDFEVPDYVVVPTSAGGNIRGIIKGFREFLTCGLIDRIPTIVCAQAQGCSPISTAFERGYYQIERVGTPSTIAHAIENPFPPSGNEVVRKLRQLGGLALTVPDADIIDAQRRLAEEGLFGQPASAVPLAALRRLRSDNVVPEGASVVCVVTGSGLKYTAAFEKHELKSYQCQLEDLESFIADQF